MRRSEDRILTTHTGSLPRPRTCWRPRPARPRGSRRRRRARRARPGRGRRARAPPGRRRRRRRQRRRDGQGRLRDLRDGAPRAASAARPHALRAGQDMLDFPELRASAAAIGADSATPACNGPSPTATATPSQRDIANFKRGARRRGRRGRVHDRRLAGRRRALPRRTSTTRPGGVPARRSPTAMKQRVRRDRRRRLRPPDRLPRPRHGPAHRSSPTPLDGVPRTTSRLHVEALNHATRDIPPEHMRIHLCWGNYEGPHHHDVPLAEIVDIVFGARRGALVRGGQPPPRARVAGLRGRRSCPTARSSIPGVHRLDDELHRAPRARRSTNRPLREARRPRERHRRHRLRLRHVRGLRPSTRRSRGRSCGPWPRARGAQRARSGEPRWRGRRRCAGVPAPD